MELNYLSEKNKNNDKDNDFLVKNESGDNLILKKKKLIDISKNLSKLEYLEIFNIIQNDKCVYSENKNGVFINLSNVQEHTIDKIFNFIDFIKIKKEDLLKYEEYVNIAKNNISDIQKSTVNNVINNNKDFIDNNYDYSDYESDDEDKGNEYLIFSSDEDDDLENKLLLKKKKIKYIGKKAKMIKSIKDSGNNKIKNKKSE